MTTGTTATRKENVKVVPVPPKVLIGCDKCGVVMTFGEYLVHRPECEGGGRFGASSP